MMFLVGRKRSRGLWYLYYECMWRKKEKTSRGEREINNNNKVCLLPFGLGILTVFIKNYNNNNAVKISFWFFIYVPDFNFTIIFFLFQNGPLYFHNFLLLVSNYWRCDHIFFVSSLEAVDLKLWVILILTKHLFVQILKLSVNEVKL